MDDNNIKFHTITMDEYRKLKDVKITYGVAPFRFGSCIIGLLDSKICYISLFDEGRDNSAIDLLQRDWPKATLVEDNKVAASIAENIFENNNCMEHQILLRGTPMQCDVWKYLSKLHKGETATYEQIAKAVGRPKAVRAIAGAIATNRIAFLIPCHRVIRKSGAPNKYRWGPERKIQLLEYEAKCTN